MDEVYRGNIGRLVARGAFTPPALAHPGARYQGEATTEEAWRETAHLWDGWGEEEPASACVQAADRATGPGT